MRSLLVLLSVFVSAVGSNASPIFSQGTKVEGVLIYRDNLTPTQFWYVPQQVPVVLGGSLEDFKVTYWGIGKKYLFKYPDGSFHSVMGATLSGRANFDISAAQRAAVIKEIQNTYGVANPAILPVNLKNVNVQPVIASTTLQLDKGDVIFPANFAFGSPFNYLIGTGNELFATYVATETTGSSVVSDPNFSLNIAGDIEFVGDPWEAHCSIDLNQYWHKTITQVHASVSWGWFQLGSADYSNIVQELSKSLKNDCNFVEGSLDTEKYGRQVFEMVKKIMEDLNAKASAGEGFFKFAPNPEPNSGGGGGAASWWPWSVSVNASYSSATSIQNATVQEDYKYTGRYLLRVPASMVLAVDCNAATSDRFVELLNPSEPCITAVKADRFTTRLQAEYDAKKAIITRLRQRYEAGEISFDEFVKEKAYFETDSSEDLLLTTVSDKKGQHDVLMESVPSERILRGRKYAEQTRKPK